MPHMSRALAHTLQFIARVASHTEGDSERCSMRKCAEDGNVMPPVAEHRETVHTMDL